MLKCHVFKSKLSTNKYFLEKRLVHHSFNSDSFLTNEGNVLLSVSYFLFKYNYLNSFWLNFVFFSQSFLIEIINKNIKYK